MWYLGGGNEKLPPCQVLNYFLFQFEVKCMPWSFGWRTLTAAALKEKVFQLGQERFLHTLTLLISILIGTKDAISRDNIKDYS